MWEELKQLAATLGFRVRTERGDFDGGSCLLRDQRIVLINRWHSIEARLTLLALALAELDLENVFVKPSVRDFIEDEIAKRESGMSDIAERPEEESSK